MSQNKETREQKAARDNRANQLNPNHMPTKDTDHPMRRDDGTQGSQTSGEEK